MFSGDYERPDQEQTWDETEDKRIAEAYDMDHEPKRIRVIYEAGEGLDQLVRDVLTHDRLRLVWCPF